MANDSQNYDKDMHYLLQHLTEECAEVIQAISKIKRFGLYDIYDPTGWTQLTNQQKFEQEVIQLKLLIEVLCTESIFNFDMPHSVREEILKKWRKWKNYSDEALKPSLKEKKTIVNCIHCGCVWFQEDRKFCPDCDQNEINKL